MSSLLGLSLSRVGARVEKDNLPSLRDECPSDVYVKIASLALPRIIAESGFGETIWGAVTEIEKLSTDELKSDPDLAGKLIASLAARYENDFKKLYVLCCCGWSSEIEWNAIQGEHIYTFHDSTYILFAADVLNTPGCHAWLEQNPQENVVTINWRSLLEIIVFDTVVYSR